MDVGLILGAVKTTPVQEMEKTANIESLERRRDLKALSQGEKMKRLAKHPLHDKLKQLTKNRLKRPSLNHRYKDLHNKHGDILEQDQAMCEELEIQDWKSHNELEEKINTSIPGITSKGQLPADLKAQTLAMME